MDHKMRVCGGDLVVSSEVFIFMTENKEFSWILDVVYNGQKNKQVAQEPVQYWAFYHKSQMAMCFADRKGRFLYKQEIVMNVDQRLSFFYIDNVLVSYNERFPQPTPIPQAPKKKKIKKGKMGYKEGVFRSMQDAMGDLRKEMPKMF